MPHKYQLGKETFIHVQPSVFLMRSTMLQGIVQDDDRQLVVNLHTGLLTVHNKPKTTIDATIGYQIGDDIFIKLSTDVEKALMRIRDFFFTGEPMGSLIVKNRPELRVMSVGNWSLFERQVRHVYKTLGEESPRPF